MNRGQDLPGSNTAELRQTVFEDALLGRNLCRLLKVLHGASAADPEVVAAWLDTERRTGAHADQMRNFKVGLSPEAGVFYNFTGKSAVDENLLALCVSDSTGFVVKGLDNADRHEYLRKKQKFYQWSKLRTMSRELITSWNDYQSAIDRILALACKQVWIYDEDLGILHFETTERIEALKRPLVLLHPDCLRIALRNAASLHQRQPLMQRLLTTYSHNSAAQQTPEHLGHLRDSMILVDDAHALIRFDWEHPRSKLLIDEPGEVMPYRRRFAQIWAEGGIPASPTTLGL